MTMTAPIKFEYTYSELPDSLYTLMKTKPFPHAKLVIFNHQLAKELGLETENLNEQQLLDRVLGHDLPSLAKPLAQAYAGHQFGHFNLLGDGRALLVGEIVTPANQRFDMHLKGSGRTPYSRQGDGKAALGPMLREYIISESMAALNIPTTRSLAVIETGEPVYRENQQRGAILVRIAGSHLRVGTFQFAAVQKDPLVLKKLLDYTLTRHFPECLSADNPYLSMLQTIICQQVSLVTNWMRVGFIHGVMNTDNMALSGETIDYGPCAFMDSFHPKTVFSAIDVQGRYAYENQPMITQWNLARFAETLIPFIHPNQNKAIALASEELKSFETLYENAWVNMMGTKLGLVISSHEDKLLIDDILALLTKYQLDYTQFFTVLTYQEGFEQFNDCQLTLTALKSWHARYANRQLNALQQKPKIHEKMIQANPVVIPRNHLIEKMLNNWQEKTSLSELEQWLSVLQKPYQIGNKTSLYQAPPKAHERVEHTFCGT